MKLTTNSSLRLNTNTCGPVPGPGCSMFDRCTAYFSEEQPPVYSRSDSARASVQTTHKGDMERKPSHVLLHEASCITRVTTNSCQAAEGRPSTSIFSIGFDLPLAPLSSSLIILGQCCPEENNTKHKGELKYII